LELAGVQVSIEDLSREVAVSEPFCSVITPGESIKQMEVVLDEKGTLSLIDIKPNGLKSRKKKILYLCSRQQMKQSKMMITKRLFMRVILTFQ
jgi:hypothetical protein